MGITNQLITGRHHPAVVGDYRGWCYPVYWWMCVNMDVYWGLSYSAAGNPIHQAVRLSDRGFLTTAHLATEKCLPMRLVPGFCWSPVCRRHQKGSRICIHRVAIEFALRSSIWYFPNLTLTQDKCKCRRDVQRMTTCQFERKGAAGLMRGKQKDSAFSTELCFNSAWSSFGWKPVSLW